MGLEAAAMPRRHKVQHIKGIANVLVDLVYRLKAVGLSHDTDSKTTNSSEFSTPFEPLPPAEPVTHTKIEVDEVLITPEIVRLA